MYAAGSKADGKVSGKRYHSFRTDAAKFCRLVKLQAVDDGGEGDGVELVGGTTTVPPREPLPSPHADTPAAKTSTMLFNDCFFFNSLLYSLIRTKPRISNCYAPTSHLSIPNQNLTDLACKLFTHIHCRNVFDASSRLPIPLQSNQSNTL